MNRLDSTDAWIAALFAGLSIAAGALWLFARGAPASMPLTNIVSGIAAGIAAVAFVRTRPGSGRFKDVVLLAIFLAIAAPLVLGPRVEGVTRWLAFGPVRLQPAMILLPLALVLHARDPRFASTLSLAGSALALALQPDRSMAVAMVVTLLALALFRGGTTAWGLVAWCAAAAVAAFARPDPLAPAPFVENVLNDAFRIGFASGIVMSLAAVAMMVPSAAARSALLAPRMAFATTWVVLLGASIVAPYPTPVLGFGASGVLGFVFSLAAMIAAQPFPASRFSR